jgi:Tfp pilus assembly PilM family ATPase
MAFFSKQLVGLDIGSNSIKLVQLKAVGKGYQLINYAIQEVSGEAVEELDPELKETVISESLKKLFKEKFLVTR